MMDITLVLVTLLSLTLAAVMTTAAWRLAREERRRSDARVALLAAEIHGDDLPLRQAPVATSSDLFAATQPGRRGRACPLSGRGCLRGRQRRRRSS
jgi:hypothetical protein